MQTKNSTTRVYIKMDAKEIYKNGGVNALIDHAKANWDELAGGVCQNVIPIMPRNGALWEFKEEDVPLKEIKALTQFTHYSTDIGEPEYGNIHKDSYGLLFIRKGSNIQCFSVHVIDLFFIQFRIFYLAYYILKQVGKGAGTLEKLANILKWWGVDEKKAEKRITQQSFVFGSLSEEISAAAREADDVRSILIYTLIRKYRQNIMDFIFSDDFPTELPDLKEPEFSFHAKSELLFHEKPYELDEAPDIEDELKFAVKEITPVSIRLVKISSEPPVIEEKESIKKAARVRPKKETSVGGRASKRIRVATPSTTPSTSEKKSEGKSDGGSETSSVLEEESKDKSDEKQKSIGETSPVLEGVSKATIDALPMIPTLKDFTTFLKEPEKAYEKFPAKKLQALEAIVRDKLKNDMKRGDVKSVIQDSELLAMPLPVKGKALNLPVLIQLEFNHPVFGPVHAIAKLWYVDYYGKDGVKQPPNMDHALEYFRYQVNQDNIPQTQVEPVRVCMFHSIEEISPRLSPLIQLEGRFFSSLNVSAIKLGCNSPGMEAWTLVGHLPKQPIFGYLNLAKKLVNFVNDQTLTRSFSFPNTLVPEVHPRDIFAFLCREECNELTCLTLKRHETSDEHCPCVHGLVHQVEATEIDPTNYDFDQSKAVKYREKLTMKWLNTDWGKRIWFYRWQNNYDQSGFIYPLYAEKLFETLRALNLHYWPLLVPFVYNSFPLISPDLINSLDDLKEWQKYFHFNATDGIVGISKFSKIKYGAKNTKEDTKEEVKDTKEEIEGVKKPSYDDKDVVFLTSWIVKKSDQAPCYRHNKPDYLVEYNVPIKRSLLEEAKLIGTDGDKLWIEKKFIRPVHGEFEEYTKYVIGNKSIRTWLGPPEGIVIERPLEATSSSLVGPVPDPYSEWCKWREQLQSAEVDYVKEMEQFWTTGFIVAENKFRDAQLNVWKFECAEDTLENGQWTTMNNAKYQALQYKKKKRSQMMKLMEDEEDKQQSATTLTDLQMRKQEEQKRQAERLKLKTWASLATLKK